MARDSDWQNPVLFSFRKRFWLPSNRLIAFSFCLLKATVKSASIRRESTQSASIQQNDTSIYADGVLSDKKKLLIEKLNRMEVSGKISIKYATEAKAVITGTDILQVITYKDVMVILSCQTTKARLILKKMEENDLIRAVQGKGKGKYVPAVPDICSED